MKILNAFSLNMLAGFPARIRVVEVSRAEARERCMNTPFKEFQSCVGHADTAVIFTAELDFPVAHNRATVSLESGDTALVGQYRGPRLPEGATALPEGATIQWLLVTVL